MITYVDLEIFKECVRLCAKSSIAHRIIQNVIMYRSETIDGKLYVNIKKIIDDVRFDDIFKEEYILILKMLSERYTENYN